MHIKKWRPDLWRSPKNRANSFGVNERFCSECGFPHHDGPLPSEVACFDSGSVSAVIYPAGGFRGKDLLVRFGRVRAGGRQLYLSEFIPTDELEDVLVTVSDLKSYLNRPRTKAAMGR